MPVDTASVAGAAILYGTIKKEQQFTALFAKRAADRLAATGDTGFRLNPKSIKPVTGAIGAAEKRHLSPDHGAKKAANLVALQATLALSAREPQAKTAMPRTAGSEYGWFWKAPEAPVIGQRPLAPAACARSGEVKYAEAFASVFMAGPLCVRIFCQGRGFAALAPAGVCAPFPSPTHLPLTPFPHFFFARHTSPAATRRSPFAGLWSAQAQPRSEGGPVV